MVGNNGCSWGVRGRGEGYLKLYPIGAMRGKSKGEMGHILPPIGYKILNVNIFKSYKYNQT